MTGLLKTYNITTLQHLESYYIPNHPHILYNAYLIIIY